MDRNLGWREEREEHTNTHSQTDKYNNHSLHCYQHCFPSNYRHLIILNSPRTEFSTALFQYFTFIQFSPSCFPSIVRCTFVARNFPPAFLPALHFFVRPFMWLQSTTKLPAPIVPEATNEVSITRNKEARTEWRGLRVRKS